MAPSSSATRPAKKGSVECDVCGASIARKADLPRHKRLHLAIKNQLMHHCPYEGCSYQNLQKSNVDTHLRTHTGERTQCCPTCSFTTSDPGSLTRHRKRVHGYEPKPRRARNGGGKVLTSKAPTRPTPYPRDSVKSSSAPLVEVTLPSYEGPDLNSLSGLGFPPLSPGWELPCHLQLPSNFASFPEDYTYAWYKNSVSEQLAAACDATTASLVPTIPRPSSPRQLFPGIDAHNALEGARLSQWADPTDFGVLPPLSHETFGLEQLYGGPPFTVSTPCVEYAQPMWGVPAPEIDYTITNYQDATALRMPPLPTFTDDAFLYEQTLPSWEAPQQFSTPPDAFPAFSSPSYAQSAMTSDLNNTNWDSFIGTSPSSSDYSDGSSSSSFTSSSAHASPSPTFPAGTMTSPEALSMANEVDQLFVSFTTGVMC